MKQIGPKAKDLYFVAVKLFLRHKERLFIFQDGFGQWDLPGGRIRYDEFKKPLETVIKRKIKEELGGVVRYKLGNPIVFMRHERPEKMPHSTDTARIFAIGYDADFLGGKIKLPSHHVKYEWASIKTLKPEKYFKGGWLAGVKEFLTMKRREAQKRLPITNNH